MRFYNNSHPYYCDIDLHARVLYVYIIDAQANVIVHKKIATNKDGLLLILEPYIGNVIVGVECMYCWYWVSDWCRELNIDFILGHALYMKAIHGGKTKNDKIDSFKIAALLRGGNFPIAYDYPREMRATRDLPATELNLKNISARHKLREQYQDPIVQRNIDMDMPTLDFYAKELAQVEWFIEKQAKTHNPVYLELLKTVPCIGKILSLTILYETGDTSRFETVQNFASYSRLVKYKAESAGKTYRTQGNKIGNAHLKWAFSETAVLYLRGNEKARRYLNQLQKRMNKAKALSALAHKLGRCVYFMLKNIKNIKNKTVFDEQRLLKG
ncbi:IS110 family transposase [Vibrio sp. WJH972]